MIIAGLCNLLPPFFGEVRSCSQIKIRRIVYIAFLLLVQVLHSLFAFNFRQYWGDTWHFQGGHPCPFARQEIMSELGSLPQKNRHYAARHR